MDRELVHLGTRELDEIISISEDGLVITDTQALARTIARPLGIVGVRVAISGADYLQQDDATPLPETRTVSGIWWHSHGDDTATVGGFTIEGFAMAITTEGEADSPVVEDVEIIARATSSIASQHDGGTVVRPGLIRIPSPSGGREARVVVTRDYRVRRPQDVLEPEEQGRFSSGALGLAVVHLIGGGKAIVITHDI